MRVYRERALHRCSPPQNAVGCCHWLRSWLCSWTGPRPPSAPSLRAWLQHTHKTLNMKLDQVYNNKTLMSSSNIINSSIIGSSLSVELQLVSHLKSYKTRLTLVKWISTPCCCLGRIPIIFPWAEFIFQTLAYCTRTRSHFVISPWPPHYHSIARSISSSLEQK